ncbi:MAG: hypothetical protein ACXWU5_09855 [Rhodoplanes sp.]
MRRPLFGVLLLAACAFPVAAGTLESAANSRAQPMQFTRHQEGPAEACGAKCRVYVFASGMITADTPRRFEAFAREYDLTGATVVLDSDGGSVRGALALGRAIRQFGFATTVGRRMDRGSTGAASGVVSAPASCESMCAFVLLGGVQREVPAKSRVLVHQIWLGDRRDDAVAASYSAEDLVLVQRDIGNMVRYTADMGGGAELIELALRIPPWEPMRALSREELQRSGLDGSAEPSEPSTAATLTPVSAQGADRAGQSNDRGWALLDRTGVPAMLARHHPLTYEGERIGNFDLVLACGDAPGSYTLTYVERRTRPASAALPPIVEQVRLWIGDAGVLFRITASEAKGSSRQVETVATTTIAAPQLRAFAGTASRSLSVHTRSAGQPATMIRIGNSGFAKSFPQFEAVCAEQSRLRIDAHAQLDQRR